jgi:lipoate-protein ligase A
MTDGEVHLPGSPRKNDRFLLRSIELDQTLVETYNQPGVEIVLGASGKPERDLFIDLCRKDGVPVRFRRGGGGAVVLSPGIIVVLAAGPLSSRFAFHRIFQHINGRLTAALESAGIADATHRGVCDLAVGDRKIHGGSLYLTRDRFFYQGSLLYDPEIGLMERYLKLPVNVPEYRAGRGHGEFCTTLTRLGVSQSIDSLGQTIRHELIDSRWPGF